MAQNEWNSVAVKPTKPGRYPVKLETGTLVIGFWSAEYGWRDGITKMNHVRLWFDLPAVPSAKR